ncbi:MAG: hypothetical protein WBP81_04855 [Solirubrobacteraceae bacterium]
MNRLALFALCATLIALTLAAAAGGAHPLPTDNGSPWYVSGAPDRHWNNDALHQLDRLTRRDFEVVNMSSLPHPGA